jgi:hypothetical protein
MGRKPVVGLVGAWLASLALAGCDNPPTWGGSKKDTVPPSNSNSSTNTGWQQSRQSQGSTTGSGTGVSGINERPAGFQGGQPTGTSGASGVGTGSNTWNPSSGSAGAGAGATSAVGGLRGPTSDYPIGRSGDSQFGSGAGNVERAAYPGTDPNGGRVTSPTTGGTGRAPGGNNLPPLSGSPSPSRAPTLADLSAQEPVTGQAIPRTQEIPPVGSTSRGPAISSGSAPGRDVSVTGTGTSTALPPPVPPPASLMGGGSDPSPGLPALPATPTPSSTTSFQRPTSGVRLMGMPANPTANPAVMQPGAPAE